MTALIICASIIAFLLFVLFLPVGIIITYKDEKPKILLSILFVKIKLYPTKKKTKTKKKADKIFSSDKSKKKQAIKHEEIKLNILDKIKIITSSAKTAFIQLGKFLHINIKRFNLSFATGDPSVTAVLYPMVLDAFDVVIDLAEEYTKLKDISHSDIYFEPNFIETKPYFDIDLKFSITVFGALITGLKTLKVYKTLQKRAKSIRKAIKEYKLQKG